MFWEGVTKWWPVGALGRPVAIRPRRPDDLCRRGRGLDLQPLENYLAVMHLHSSRHLSTLNMSNLSPEISYFIQPLHTDRDFFN